MLQLVPIHKINDYWPVIRAGLFRVLDKSPDIWKPEDVYMEIMQGRSELHVAEDDEGLMGFVVLTPYFQYGNMVLHIWIALNNRSHDDVVFGTDEIKQIARDINANYITTGSARKGIGKFYDEFGFKFMSSKYIYKV